MPPSPPQFVVPILSRSSSSSTRSNSSLPSAPSADGTAMVEVIKDRLYFASFNKPPAPSSGVQYFSTDRSLVYWNFFLDFGPMNLGQTYRFCEMVQNRLDSYPKDRIVYYCANHGQRRANSIFLICAYAMMVLGYSAEDAYRPFQHIPVTPFHDATPTVCTYELTVLDCLKGMDKARRLGFLNFETFDVEEYEYFEKVENGDLTWIFPGRFVAFAGPHEKKSFDEMYPTCVPEDYVPYFLQKKVSLVVRLNKKYYDENRFKNKGVDHVDLYYPDGSCPSEEILDRFLQICESRSTEEGIAVHCKAGLGRTGTCIGAYAMKHWGFTASEVIGWMRVARPGSVIGPQQQFLESIQEKMHRAGRRTSGLGLLKSISPSLVKPQTSVMPLQQPKQTEFDEEDEKTQGDFLINAKVTSPHSPATVRKSMSRANTGGMEVEISSTTSSESLTGASTGSSSPLLALRGVARRLYGTGK